jgi:L-xylulokinase
MVVGPVVVGVDAGLTSIKAVVVDATGQVLGVAARPCARHEGAGGRRERDLWAQWLASAAIIREALARAGNVARQVAGVGVTGHGDGLIMVGDDNMPVRPGILSLDTRVGGIVAELEHRDLAGKMARVIGRPPAAGRPITLLLWTQRHEPEFLRAARWLLFTKDWIKLRLTGRATTDFTDASAGLLFRSEPRYAESFLEGLGLGEVVHKLPELVPSVRTAGRICPEAAEATGLPVGTPVASGSHDCSASMVGAGAVGGGKVGLIAGTWSLDASVLPDASAQPDPTAQGMHTRWFVDAERFLVVSSSPSGMHLLERFQATLPARRSGESDFMAGFLQAGRAESGDSLPTVIPSVQGLGVGHRSGASVLGLEASHGPSELGHALAEAMAFRHRRGCELLGTQTPVTEFRVTGGISRSDLWSQLLADVLGHEVVRPDSAEAGAGGAAAMAGVAAGTWPSLEEAARAVGAAGTTFWPRSSEKGRLDERYGDYLAAVDWLARSHPASGAQDASAGSPIESEAVL